MSESEIQHTISETVQWHGDWQREVSQEQRDQARTLFAEMMTDYPPNHLQHIKDHAREAIGTVLDQKECRRGRLDERGPVLEFSFTRGEVPLYLTTEFLDGGRSLWLNFTNTAPTSLYKESQP